MSSLWGSISGLGSGLKDITQAAVQLGQQALNAADGSASTANDGWGASDLDDVDLADELYGDESAPAEKTTDKAADADVQTIANTQGGMASMLKSSALGAQLDSRAVKPDVLCYDSALLVQVG